MQANLIQPVIIAGGSGTRLWPVSRRMYPKQFLPLTSSNAGVGKTLLQQTVQRLDGIQSKAPIVVCNDEHRFIAAEQLRQLDCQHNGLILEPAGRNTAPAICLAALRALEVADNPLLLVLPADHHIADQARFARTVKSAASLISKGQMVTFGITPDQAATGYGYIKAASVKKDRLNQVEQFVEKPSRKTAEKYFASSDYFWNSGMFMFYAQDYLDELALHSSEIMSVCEQAWKGQAQDLEFIRVDAEVFAQCSSDSIDYAVMEHTKKAYVMPLDAQWSDVGGWATLAKVMPTDEKGNVLIGDVLCLESQSNFVRAEDKLVAVLGVDDLVVVDTKDALLVASKDQAEEVKKIVDRLNQDGRQESTHHRVVYRPWGHYDSMDSGERFQVKRISVKAGAKLSVQMHHHRAEHWVVVVGTAKVRVGDEERILGENESVYIPVGTTHSLENPGKIPLELIEVQSGAYLGEDDIVRFEDRYGRS